MVGGGNGECVHPGAHNWGKAIRVPQKPSGPSLQWGFREQNLRLVLNRGVLRSVGSTPVVGPGGGHMCVRMPRSIQVGRGGGT